MAVKIPLSRFIDFVGARTQDAREKKVREIKRQLDEEEYKPYSDPYKPLREAIQAAGGKKLDKPFPTAERVNLPSLAKKWNAFVGARVFSSYSPASGEWSHGSLIIKVNPDIALREEGEDNVRHLKIYFKKNPPDKRQSKLLYQLKLETLRLERNDMGILALRRSGYGDRMIIPIHNGVGSSNVAKMLRREAEFFARIWQDV